MKKYDVYLCYAREDEMIVYPFRERLTYDGVLISDPQKAERDAESVSNAIKDCIVVLYFHTIAAEQSNWIKKELTLAKALNINVIPVYVSSTELGYTQMAQLLKSSKWITSSSSSMGVLGGFELIIKTVKTSVKEYNRSQKDRLLGPRIREIKKDIFSHTIVEVAGTAFMIALCLMLGVGVIMDWSFADYALAVLVIVAIFVLIGLVIVGGKLNTTSTRSFRNRSMNYGLTIRLDGEDVAQIPPLGIVTIEKKCGQYMLTARASNAPLLNVISRPVEFVKSNRSTVDLDIESTARIETQHHSKYGLVKYRCFIGGSTAITNERNAVRAALSILYNQYEKYDFYITSHTFEDFKNKHKIDGQQYDYNEFIKLKADCAIFVICNQVGKKTLGEYRLAVKTFEASGEKRPAIFVYNDISYRSKGGTEDASVTAFHKLVVSKNAYWRDYDDIDMLMMKIKEDISAELADILEMRPGR